VHGWMIAVSAHEEQFQPFIWNSVDKFASASFPSAVRASLLARHGAGDE